FASGKGTTLQAIINAVTEHRISRPVSAVISDHEDSGALERARVSGIHAVFLDPSTGKEKFYASVMQELHRTVPEIIVLAGFMRIIPAETLLSFGAPVINLHPSLLPCFGGKGMYGMHVHSSVIESGARYSGCTVHFVTPEVDAGPIIVQKVIEVLDSDTPESLADRIRPLEHEAVVEAIQLVLSGNYAVSGKRVLRK
ncbi:MAG: phosphoribosylglycinamide formyltransferase, partial [Thermoplasmataceae archaeon]